MALYSSLLANWLSIWYTTMFYWSTGYLYGTLLSPIGPLAIPMVHYPPLLAISMIHYYLILAHWLSLWYATLPYWPTGYLFGTLLSSTGPLDISMLHCYLLLIHWISLCYTTLFYWPTGYLYGTFPSHFLSVDF